MYPLGEHDLSHEALCKRLQEDPDGFNYYVDGLILEFIESAPEEVRERLRQTQWVVDGLKYKYKDPLVRLMKISTMMLGSVHDLNVELHTLKQELEDLSGLHKND